MRQKKFIPSLALVLVCGVTIEAAAAGAVQTIQAALDPTITVTLDGEAQTLLDASGNRVYPVTYNGTTYMPVRAVDGLVGLDVNWDQATRTVQLNATKGVDLIDTYKYYYSDGGVEQRQTAGNKTMDISGINCSHWVNVWTGRYAPSGNITVASFSLQGKYDTVTFKYYSDTDCILRVLGDNETVLFEKEVAGGQVVQTAVDVKLFSCNEMSFQRVNTTRTEGHLYIFDAYLDA